VTEIHWLDIRHLREGEGLVGTLSEDEGADRCNSALFSCLGGAGTGRHHFCTLPLLAPTLHSPGALLC